MKILVVDDSSNVSRIITNTLQDIGYTDVVTAEDVPQAHEILRSTAVDFIILDGHISGMDGDLVRELKLHGGDKVIPVLIVLRGFTSQFEAGKIQSESGAEDCIKKPFTPTELKMRIKWILEPSPGIE